MPISDDVLLVHGDCFDVMPKIPAGSVDMVFCDLPYGVTANQFDLSVSGKRLRSVPIDKRVFPIRMEQFWVAINTTAKTNCAKVLTAIQPFSSFLVYSNTSEFKYSIVWDKVSTSRWFSAKKLPLCRHEDVLVFYSKSPTYNPQMVARDRPVVLKNGPRKTANYHEPNRHLTGSRISTHRYPTSIQKFCRGGPTIHPNQKPVALLEWLIRTYTNPGDLVLDPCSGSGTTAIAALNTGRRAICIEKDAGYHAAAVKRLVEARRAPKQASLAI